MADFATLQSLIDANGRLRVQSPGDVISITPTVSTSAYSIGDCIGGKQTLTDAARLSGGTTVLYSLNIIDKSNQKPEFTILFFNADPSAATITDNAAFAWSTDIAKYVGMVSVTADDYKTIDSKAIARPDVSGLEMKASGSANLYAVVVADAVDTLVSTSDLTFLYGFLPG